MATKTHEALVCLVLFVAFSTVQSFMDIEELQTINYGISILNEPIVIPETHPDSAILVTSRHGQQYQCNYPTHQEQKQQKAEEEKIAMETGIVELLKPMAQSPCLIKTKDWWTYEICYGKHVRQYHLEDGVISGNIMYLGYYSSEFDWNNETLREARVKSKISSGRYHSQYYSNGSRCDLTGNGRETEVRYLCEEGEDDFIARVDEPETCVYVITVYTARTCKHPHLKSPTPTQPIPIVCVPLLTNHQYLKYQEHAQAVKQKEEEALAKAKAELELMKKEQEEAKAKLEDESIEGGLTDSLNSLLKRSLGKEFKDVGSDAKDAAGSDSTFDPSAPDTKAEQTGSWKAVKDIDDLEGLLEPQGILSNVDMSNKGQNSQPSESPSGAKSVDAGSEGDVTDGVKDESEQPQPETKEKSLEGKIDDAIDDAVDSELDEFEREVTTLRKRQAMTQKRLQQIKDRVKKTVTSQFKDIIEEAEAELGGEVNEAVALTQLASSLNSLMEKLENTEKEMKDMDREIENIAGSKGADKEKKGDREVDEIEEESQTTLEEEDDLEAGVQAPPTTKHGGATEAGVKDGGRWKMRVRTVAQDDLMEDPAVKALPARQQSKLESSFRDQLQKAGVDPSSVKVHVKIISSSQLKDKDDDSSLHVLSDDESASFQDMIVAILGGSNEEEKEQKRHSEMEDSYNFVFESDQEVAQSDLGSSSADTDADQSAGSDSDSGVDSDADDTVTLPEQGM